MPSLTAPPALLPLYAKAAVTSPLHRGGDALPDSVYSLTDQTIDREHLAAFQQVCGHRVTDVLPPTYLHVLAFPLSVALMTEPAFPFPLVGMVHVANTIRLSRAVRADETVSFTVRAAQLRPHAAGTQFDLLADATVDGASVWSSRSTYLRRGKPSGASKSAKRPELAPPSGAALIDTLDGSSTGSLKETSAVYASGNRPSSAASVRAFSHMPCPMADGNPKAFAVSLRRWIGLRSPETAA